MQRFYFDINDGRERAVDTEGQVLESIDDACRLAAQELSQIIRDEVPDGQRESYVVTIRDANGTPVYVAVAQMLGEYLS